MKSPFKLELPYGISSLLTVRKWKRERGGGRKLQYANSKLIGAEFIKIFRQYFGGFTFYLEQITYYIQKSLVLKIRVKRPCFIFIYVITGDVQVTIPNSKNTVVVEQRQYFAHLMPAGEYFWVLQKGKKKFIYFTLLPEWVTKMRSEYPGLIKFIEKLQKGDVPNEILPSYTMTVKTLMQLDRLMNCKASSKVELEEMLLNTINKLVKEYHANLTASNQLVYKSNNQIAYEVRDHIIDLVERGILPFVRDVSANFNIEPKTLGRFCYGAFRMNAQELITDAQMKKAYNNLKNGALVKEVALSLGYSEAATFSRRFKDYFGYSPVEVISNIDT